MPEACIFQISRQPALPHYRVPPRTAPHMTEVTVRIHQGIGGGERDRTDDLLLAKQALSQLSYTPVMVGLRRVELLTSPLSGVRSNQLSYRPARATAGLKAAGGVSQLRRKHKRPVALSVSPVMKGHEDDGNVLWKTAKLFRWLASALSRISLERR